MDIAILTLAICIIMLLVAIFAVLIVKNKGNKSNLDKILQDINDRQKDEIVENVKENLNTTIYKTIIPRNVKLAEAPSHGLPINLYDKKSAGAESYRLLAKEVMNRKDL